VRRARDGRGLKPSSPRVGGMSAKRSDTLAPRSCQAQDVAALIGLLALLEGELMEGGVPERLSARVRDRLERVGLLGAGEFPDWPRLSVAESDRPGCRPRLPSLGRQLAGRGLAGSYP
jgi:hypothetical protein